jgi:hypothetical protein
MEAFYGLSRLPLQQSAELIDRWELEAFLCQHTTVSRADAFRGLNRDRHLLYKNPATGMLATSLQAYLIDLLVTETP